jgi:hypothetical protein
LDISPSVKNFRAWHGKSRQRVLRARCKRADDYAVYRHRTISKFVRSSFAYAAILHIAKLQHIAKGLQYADNTC